MSALYLIRHGKTRANERHLYCGSTDLPLSPLGAAELKQLSYRVENARFVTSGMKRTEETLQILFGDVPHTADPGLREIDFGVFEMQDYQQLKDRPDYQAWITGDNASNVPPQGESGVQMGERVWNAFSKWRDLPGNTVIIAHGGVIARIMAQLFPSEEKNLYQWQPKNGCGYMVQGESYRSIPE